MTIFVNPGDTVEGAKCNVYTRKYVWKGLRKDPVTNKNMTLYELDRNCSVEIVEQMQLDAAGLQLRQEKGVHLNVGDKIKGDAAQLYVDSIRKDLRFEVKEGQSGRHGASLASSVKRTIGRLKYSFDNYKHLLGHSTKGYIENKKED